MSTTPPTQHKLAIVYQPANTLKPRSTNPRTHSKKQINQIANAMRRFGFTNPILVDDSIIAGHGRVEAAKSIGLDQVPTVRLSTMSEAEIRAYVIADNELAENAGWDRNLLGIELQYLSELEADFDVTVTGFDLAEIDILIEELTPANQDDPADELIEPVSGSAITRDGDVWQIGDHRLVCGDSTKPETYQALLGDKRAQMVFSDPPYNVPIAGHVGGLGKIQHREFAMASGEMSNVEFTTFLTSVFTQLATHSECGAIHFQCIDWRYAGVNGFGNARSYLELHPTVKPVALVEDAIRDCSRRKGIVLDPFCGSGTTLIAAQRTGRRGFGIELDPLYCDVILRRLRSVCGLRASLRRPAKVSRNWLLSVRRNSRPPKPGSKPNLLRPTVASGGV